MSGGLSLLINNNIFSTSPTLTLQNSNLQLFYSFFMHEYCSLFVELKCIPGDYLMKLVERMPRVCKAVIKAKGGYFEEYKIYFLVTT